MIRFLLINICLFSASHVFSQSKAFEQRIAHTDSVSINDAREKIFIHHDRPTYQVNDTLWLKGCILEASEHAAYDSSGLVYIEFYNEKNELVKRINPLCIWGLFSANVTLGEASFKQGKYVLRAYTNRMRNFGEELFFKGSFTIIDPQAPIWKTKVHSLSFQDSRLQFSASLSSGQAVDIDKNITIRLLSENKSLYTTKIIFTGSIDIDTVLTTTGNQKDFLLEIKDSKNLNLQLPVKADRSDVDLQFFPEGGTLIVGKRQRLGFKALNVVGKGEYVKGSIVDSKGTVGVTFASIHRGMGMISFTPKVNEIYKAVLENGQTIQLPLAQSSGVMLQVLSDAASDSLWITIDASEDMKGKFIYFAGVTRGYTYTRGRIEFSGKPNRLLLDKKQFPSGVTVFTLYDENLSPINERAILLWHHDDLKLSLTSHKEVYNKKDSVSLTLNVTKSDGEATGGIFSMAVIDTSQVKIYPDAENLLSYMLLSSDVKGEIENPYYYFKNPASAATEALMLTQGWVSYNRSAPTVVLPYEKKFTIRGKVTNLFNQSVKGTSVALLGIADKNEIFALDTTTDDQGIFTFSDFSVYDTDKVSMVIKAVNKRNKANNIGVELFEQSFPDPYNAPVVPFSDIILLDSAANQYIFKQDEIKIENQKGVTVLDAVTIKSTKIIEGSHNLNGGGADQIIDEDILEKAPKESLLNLLEREVNGFRLTTAVYGIQRYQIKGNAVKFIIDGIPLNLMYGSFIEITSFLKNVQAEEIKGIELMNTPKFNDAYRNRFQYIFGRPRRVDGDYSFIEITTKSGNGPYIGKQPGSYLLTPLYPFVSKGFYSPRYTSPDQETLTPDLRSTIYWNPQIIADEGKATVSFYTSESNSNYIIIVQGTDMKGKMGILYQPLSTK